MEFRMGKAGPLVAAGIAIYVLVMVAQSRAAANLCDRYSVGSRIEDIEDLDGTFFLSRMGPFPEHPDKSGAQEVIFCASLTMCDTSCWLEIEDQVVKSARYSAI